MAKAKRDPMWEIEQDFSDIDFKEHEAYIEGIVNRTDGYGETHPELPASTRARYPRDSWPEICERNRSLGLVYRRVYNQGQEGQCAFASSVQGWFAKAILQFGYKNIPPDGLSAHCMYQECVPNPNTGYSIGGALDYFRKRGTVPLATDANRAWMRDRDLNPDHVAPESQWGWRAPAEFDETRQHFKPRELNDCRDVPDMVSSMADNDPVIGGRDGHAICYIDFWSVFQASLIICDLDYINSWGRWGSKLGPKPEHKQYGRGRDSESKLANQIGRYGAVRIHAVHESHVFD